jgi:hypothetical protein
MLESQIASFGHRSVRPGSWPTVRYQDAATAWRNFFARIAVVQRECIDNGACKSECH